MRALTRRQVLGLASGVVLAGVPARQGWPQPMARVVVVGGGFAGATCAKYLRRAEPRLEVTLVEPHRQFVTCPFSNTVLVGLRDLASVTYNYDGLRQRHGVRVVPATATTLDPPARRVRLDDGSTLAYERLVLAPGVREHLAGRSANAAAASATRGDGRRWPGGDDGSRQPVSLSPWPL